MAAMAALYWLSHGWGYEITSLDVLDAYHRVMDAATKLCREEDTVREVKQLIDSKQNQSTKILRHSLLVDKM